MFACCFDCFVYEWVFVGVWVWLVFYLGVFLPELWNCCVDFLVFISFCYWLVRCVFVGLLHLGSFVYLLVDILICLLLCLFWVLFKFDCFVFVVCLMLVSLVDFGGCIVWVSVWDCMFDLFVQCTCLGLVDFGLDFVFVVFCFACVCVSLAQAEFGVCNLKCVFCVLLNVWYFYLCLRVGVVDFWLHLIYFVSYLI